MGQQFTCYALNRCFSSLFVPKPVLRTPSGISIFNDHHHQLVLPVTPYRIMMLVKADSQDF